MKWTVLALAALGPAAAMAQSAASPDPAGPEAGQVAFMEACAGCHGGDAKGDGPTAQLLTIEVPDLTLIAARSDGGYDLARVIRLIDGREGIAAHGGPMPLFGGLLTGPSAVVDGPDGSPVATTEPILAIARWLETVQEDPE
jgi:mono/diheme cytochrome c family protein